MMLMEVPRGYHSLIHPTQDFQRAHSIPIPTKQQYLIKIFNTKSANKKYDLIRTGREGDFSNKGHFLRRFEVREAFKEKRVGVGKMLPAIRSAKSDRVHQIFLLDR